MPKILKEGQEAGKIVAGDPDRLALTIGAALHVLVAKLDAASQAAFIQKALDLAPKDKSLGH